MVLKIVLLLILISFAIINFKTKGKHKLLRICGITFGILSLCYHFLSNAEIKSISIPVKTINETKSVLNIYSISFYEDLKPFVRHLGRLNPEDTLDITVELEGVLDLWLAAIDKNREIKQMMKKEDGEYNIRFHVTGKDTVTSRDKDVASKLIKQFKLERLATWLMVSLSVISILTLAISMRKKTTANIGLAAMLADE